MKCAALVSFLFDLALIKIPIAMMRWIPRCSSLVSLAHLYLFMQALGILWLLFVSGVSVAATRLGTNAVASVASIVELPQLALRLWVHVSIFKVGIGFGKSLWRNGWETYADFPTCKALLNPKLAQTVSTRFAQIVLLMCPLVVFAVIAGMVGLIQFSMHMWHSEEIERSFADPSERLNRMVRFTVWIGFLQWAQMFQFVFPQWVNAVSRFTSARRWTLNISFLILIPVSLFRCMHWLLLSAQTHTVFGISFDCVLMVAWAAVMYSVATCILGSRENLALAGWRRQAFTDGEIWSQGAILMKFGFLFACVLMFLRSFLNPSKGFSYAQSDLVVLTVAYPLLMVVTWFSTNSALLLLKRRFSGIFILAFGPVSFILCRLAAVPAPGAVAGVWIQLIKLFVSARSIRRGENSVSSSAKTVERELAFRFFKLIVPATLLYGVILLILSLLSLMQSQVALSHDSDYLSVFKPEDAPQSVAIRHAVSQVNLFSVPRQEQPAAEALAIYGICSNNFWGLNVVDFGLFSMLAYAGNAESTQKAVSIIFPDSVVEVVNEADFSKDKFWTEFNVNNITTVIAIRGSEYWRASDYLEDLRIWTEPVAKSLLTLVFPSVRAWSPKTTAMVFDAYQEFLAFIGLPDDQEYKYQRLLEYIRSRNFDSSRKVVLTGHSLGGGIASIAGAIAKLPSVTFLSPGMYQTASKFFFHSSKSQRQIVDMVHNQSVSIQVENDFVGKYLDSHAGLVQTITCSVDHLAPLTCHLIDNSVCNLIRHCRDPRWPGGCEFKYDLNIFLNATFPDNKYIPLRSLVLEPIAGLFNAWFSDEQPHRAQVPDKNEL